MNAITLLSATLGIVIAAVVTAGVVAAVFMKPNGFENDLDQ